MHTHISRQKGILGTEKAVFGTRLKEMWGTYFLDALAASLAFFFLAFRSISRLDMDILFTSD
jgi:hypothetical protein